VINKTATILLLSALPLAASAAAPSPELLAAAAGEQAPMMRIGLDAADSLQLSAGKPFRIIDPGNGKEVWKARFEGDLQVVAEGGPGGPPQSIYRVQVRASLSMTRTGATGASGSAAVKRGSPSTRSSSACGRAA